MPTKPLPGKPDLQHLKNQARDLLRDHRLGKLDACQRIREFHPRFRKAADSDITTADFNLADALLSIAREYGFPSWARLRTHVEQRDGSSFDSPHHEKINNAVFRRAVELADDGDVDALRQHLADNPEVIRQRVVFEGVNYFREPGLLEFIAENPVRHESLPPNIADVARTILDAGARDDRVAIDSTLGLVCSGRVARECGVQVPLIDLLCDYGANPGQALPAALAHGEFEAAEALIRRGATVGLLAAAALGRTQRARQSLPTADGAERHEALALAAQHGRADVVRVLLEAGEDPNRYNPIGFHSHSTPLHQAALAGHIEVVRVLLEAGARLDIRDIHYDGTALEWAEHGGQTKVSEYLAGFRRPGSA